MVNLTTDTYYHIYNRGNNRQLIFFNEGNYYYFLRLFKKYILDIADIYSYCLLPNHFHFVIKTKNETEINEKYKKGKTVILHQAFSNLFNAYTKAINIQQKRVGSLFQKKFKRKEILSTEQLIQTIIYVNTNPSHHSIMDYKSYTFSSYFALITNKQSLIKRNEVIDFFGDINNLKFMFESKKNKIENDIEG